MRYALLDGVGTVRNVYAGAAPGTVPCGDDRVGPGWSWDGTAWAPPHLASLEAARAWAVEAIDAAETSRTTHRHTDGIVYGIGERSQAQWTTLFALHEQAAKVGVSIWPRPFRAADGTEVVLDDATEARLLFLALGQATLAKMARTQAVRDAVEDARTVAEVVAAVTAFEEGS